MNNLKEAINKIEELAIRSRSNQHMSIDFVVKFSLIQEPFAESFNKFMYGQTCVMHDNEYAAYTWDFLRWYENDYKKWLKDNEKAINREVKIDDITE